MQAKILLSVLLIAFCTLTVSICLGNEYNAYILNKKKDYYLGDTIYVISQIPIQKSMQVDFLNPELLKNFDLLGEETDTVKLQNNLFFESKIELKFKKVGRQFLPVKVNKNDTANFGKKGMYDSLTVICNQITQSHKFDNLFSSSPRFSSHKRINKNIADKDIVFIKVEPQKMKVKLGEELIIDFNVYSLSSFNIQESRINGVQFAYTWEEKDCIEDKLEIQTVNINGVYYEKQLLKRIHIFPQNAGGLEIGGGQITGIANVVSNRNTTEAQLANISGQQLMDTTRLTINCPIVEILVDGQSGVTDFITGDYTLTRWPLDSIHVGQKEPIELKFKLEGYGNLKYKTIPELSSNEVWDIMSAGESDSFYIKNDRVYGFRIWSYTLYPKEFGKLRLPEIRIPSLSLKSGIVEMLKSEQGFISILDPDANMKIADQKRKNQEKTERNNSIILVCGLVGISLIILFSILFFRKKYLIPKQLKLQKELKEKIPFGILKQEIEEFEKKYVVSNGESKTDMYKIFSRYFASRFDTNEKDLNEVLINKILREKYINEKNIQNLIVIQDKLLENDFGIGHSEEQIQKLMQGLKQCITKIEEDLDTNRSNTFV